MTDVFNFNKGALTAIPTILYPTPKQKSSSAIVQKNNAETLRENVKTPQANVKVSVYGTKFSTPYNKEHMCAREEMVYVSMEQLMTDHSKDPRPEMHNIRTKALLVNLGTILFPPLEKNLIASICICCNDAHGNCSVQSLKGLNHDHRTTMQGKAEEIFATLVWSTLSVMSSVKKSTLKFMDTRVKTESSSVF